MGDFKPVSTPMDPNVMLGKTEASDESKDQTHTENDYTTCIGELLYTMHATRPNILYAVITLSQFTNRPSTEHWTALKCIYRYLKGTANHKLTYRRNHSSLIEPDRFINADWGSNEHRKLISGYIFTIAGGAVTWRAKKQARVALSTTEAEYASTVHAVKQILWVRNLYQELGLLKETPSILHCNTSQSPTIPNSVLTQSISTSKCTSYETTSEREQLTRSTYLPRRI